MKFKVRSTSPSEMTFVGRVFGTVFFSLFAFSGLFMMREMGRPVVSHLASYAWTETSCEIRTSEREPDTEKRVRIQYEYLADGARYFSDVVTTGGGSVEADSVVAAEKLLQRYPVGATVPCYFDSGAPELAMLERRSIFFPLILLFPLVFVLVGGGGIAAMWYRFGNGGGPTAPQSKLRKVRITFAAWLFPILFFGVFALVGALMAYFMLIRPAYQLLQAQNWDAIRCRVISSEVKSHSGDSTTYSPHIVYSYSFGGREFRSDQYDFWDMSSSGYDGKQEIVNGYPPGSDVTCYVNPLDPTDSVLSREPSWVMAVGLVPILFLGAGLGGLGYFWSHRPKGTKTSGDNKPSFGSALGSGAGQSNTSFGSRPTSATPAFGARPFETDGDAPGTKVLHVAASRKLKLIGFLFAAVLWNGILLAVVTDGFSGKGDWSIGGSLFAIPFVLVGLALWVGVAYAVLSMFNPEVTLTLDPGSLRLGGRVKIAWRLSGRTHWLRTFAIELEGREEARYRRGTNTYTDRNVFFLKTIVQHSFTPSLVRGEVIYEMPADTMHTFQAPNNNIAWQIRVKGEIERYPDLAEEYPVTVLPIEGEIPE